MSPVMNALVEKFARFNTCGLPGLSWAVASGASLKFGVQGASATNWFSRVNDVWDNGIRLYHHNHDSPLPVVFSVQSHCSRRSQCVAGWLWRRTPTASSSELPAPGCYRPASWTGLSDHHWYLGREENIDTWSADAEYQQNFANPNQLLSLIFKLYCMPLRVTTFGAGPLCHSIQI